MIVNIFHAELHARSIAFFGWWTSPEPLLEEHADQVDADAPVDAAAG